MRNAINFAVVQCSVCSWSILVHVPHQLVQVLSGQSTEINELKSFLHSIKVESGLDAKTVNHLLFFFILIITNSTQLLNLLLL